MFYAEMKKIWRPVIVIITVMISILIFFSFMFGCIKPFQAFNGTDSLGVKLEICSNLIDKYGNSIEPKEFAEAENDYSQLMSGANSVISENELFARNGIKNREDYIRYMQNAINGSDGYDYTAFSEMRDMIINETGLSPLYFEVYEDILQKYREAYAAGDGRTGILPFEILVYSNNYFVYLIILCIICAFPAAALVMVNDRSSNVSACQYSGSKGRRIYMIQYICMNISAAIIVSVAAAAALYMWKTTGAFKYAGSAISSFLNEAVSVMPLTYGRLVVYFVLIAYILALAASGIVFFLSANSTSTVNMLTKAVPVIIAACIIGLLMQDAFCESNAIYSAVHIPYCELITVFIVFAVSVLLNIANYRLLQRHDV
ncbi:MAG: hypothetical protein MR576_01845 [Firmicutes bacterium]|nr:hypothetical protein [Bacillota bacterium]